MSISDKMVTVAENMEKVFAAGARSGGADWNANEGEAGYVANRTHYKTSGATVTTMLLENLSVYNGFQYFTNEHAEFKEAFSTDTNPMLVVGEKYKVTYDDDVYGVDVECEAFVSRGTNNIKYVSIGDSALAGGGYTGGKEQFPFFVVCPTGTKVFFYTKDEGEHNITIERIVEGTVYETLDPNYLPDEVRADKLEKRLPDIITGIVGNADGGLISVPTIELKIVEQDNSEKIFKVYGYTEDEYKAATKLPTLPVFDFEIEKADGTMAKYKLYGYEVGNGVE